MALDIGAWLRELGLQRYEQAFADNDVDARVLPELTADDLKDIGVTSVGHRRALLAAIEALGKFAPTERDAPATPRAEAERRQLTVMFCDLVGSTALSAQLDPEDMREVIRSYQDACAGVITRFEGFVAKYMGDGVLAYFGYPRAHEDDAERAVRAGLALTEAVARLATRGDQALAARIGIATGVVVVGDLVGEGASQEQAVVGDAPNLAARLQGVAQPGQVVIAAATRRLLGKRFDLADLGPQELKGLAEPTHAFAVRGERASASRFEAQSGGAMLPLVGRDQELALLLERWGQAKVGEGQAVLLVGEAGIGKSRISRALLDALEGESHIRIRYQCSPYHTDSALWPVIQQLGHAAGFAGDDAPEARLDKLEALLSPAEGQAAPLIADLLGMDGAARYGALNLTPPVQRARTLEALVRQLLALASERPVLVLLEDAHWIDPTTLEMIGQALDRIADARVLIALTSRPDQQPELAAHPHVTRLTLNRLSRAGAEAIVTRLGGGHLSGEVIDIILARTDGVPLFVEELTKTILEIGEASIPASLHDSLMARLDRIPEVKEVAQIAACIGRDFSYALLDAAAGKAEPELIAGLDKLASAEIIFRRGTPPDARYTFKHALVRDSAYQSLLRSKRQQLHGQIAKALEQRFPDTAESEPELLAHHYTGAGLTAQAIAHWRKAGARAIERSANAEATAHLGRGLELLETLPESHDRAQVELQLLVPLGQALSVTKGRGSPEAERTYVRAWELCQEVGGDAPQLFSVFLGLWGRRFVRAEFQAAEELLEQWSSLAERISDPDALVTTTAYMRGGIAYFRGEVVLARTHFEQVLASYHPRERGSIAVRYGMYSEPALACGCWRAESLLLLGHGDQALAQSDAALALARQLGHPPSLTSAIAWTAILHSTRRDVRAAREHAEATIALATELGFPYRLAEGKIIRGWSLAAAGEMIAGLAELREGIDAWRATGAGVARPWWLALLAEAYERAGQPELAVPAVIEALETANETGERLFEAELHRLHGALLLQEGGTSVVERAEACFRQALAVALRQKTRLFELRAATSLARLCYDQGKRAQARDLLTPIYGWFTEGFDTRDLKDAKALLDELG